MVVRQDILGGLKVALAKGKPLQETMQAFYNAGYKKEEIEEAARALYAQRANPNSFPSQNRPPTQNMQGHSQIQSSPVKEKKGFFGFLKKKKQPLQNQVNPTKPVQVNQHYNHIVNNKYIPQRNIMPPKPVQVQANPMIKKPQFKPLAQNTRPAPKQIVSAYNQEKEKYGIDSVTIILVVILLVLIGVLVAIFFYKDPLVSFLNQYLE